MKTIPLTQSKIALVDDEDYDELIKYRWYSRKDTHSSNNVWYAQRKEKEGNGTWKTIPMHQHITGFKYKMIDHVNGDGLDNRKCNLRSCTPSQNGKNSRKYKNNTSGLIGVFWKKQGKKWFASIRKDNKQIHIGYFDDKIEAGKAFDKKSLELFGEFAVLNFKEKIENVDK